MNKPKIYRFTDRSKLLIERGMTGATGNIYCGLHEFHDMGFLLHFLRPTDTFLDVGANVGTYTVLASAHVGADTIAIEPIQSTFAHLKANIELNNITKKTSCYNIALGAQNGFIHITANLDTTNHVALPDEPGTNQVEVKSMDALMADKPTPVLVKVDVEGYETEVFKGGESTFSNKNLQAIIIELNGAGERYGFDEMALHEKLNHLGFKPFDYNAFERELHPVKQIEKGNFLYLRDIDFVSNRVRAAEKITLPAMSI